MQADKPTTTASIRSTHLLRTVSVLNHAAGRKAAATRRARIEQANEGAEGRVSRSGVGMCLEHSLLCM